MSSLSLINGVDGQLTDWSQINWRKARKTVKNLRGRIFRARSLGKWKQLRRLQKLLLRSQANLLLSVRQITQVNQGVWKSVRRRRESSQWKKDLTFLGLTYVTKVANC